MSDITITRGVLFREDWLSATGSYTWTLDSGVIITSDGDVATITGLSPTNGATANTGATGTTTAASVLFLRGASPTGAVTSFDAKITYADATSQTVTLPLAGANVEVAKFFPLTANKNLNGSTIKLLNANPSTGSVLVDIVMLCKENLTLPGIIQPMPVSTGRIVAVLPILQRDGEVLQDLGSKSPEIIIQGALVSTMTPTNHTAAEWWDLLEGLILEGANETWQWVTSDRIHYKYLPIDLSRSEILSRKNYYEFTLRLKRFDVLSQTPDRLGITY